jgi:hypothetical protein
VALLSERALDVIAAKYTRAVRSIADGVTQHLDFEGGRSQLNLWVQQSLNRLNQLDQEATRWVSTRFAQVYKETRSETAKAIREMGREKRRSGGGEQNERISRVTVQATVNDVLKDLHGATKDIRDRIRAIQSQWKILRAQRRAIQDTVARVGALEGQQFNQVRSQVVRELKSLGNASDLVWRSKFASMPQDSILKNVSGLFRVQAGGSTMQIDAYVRLVVNTRSCQLSMTARREKLLQHGEQLVRVSVVPQAKVDACSVYAGKVFALTEEAARRWKVPRVEQLPSDGPPFHANCRHSDQPFFPEEEPANVRNFALKPPPRWALNRTWAEVERDFRTHGKRGRKPRRRA